MAGNFNEATRVQMPAIVHLTRLGYEYYGKILESDANIKYDPDTNILLDVFKTQFKKLNPNYTGNVDEILKDIKAELDNDDLGRSFYKRLKTISPIKLIDFDDPNNNTFHVTAEFTCKRDDDEFRPDITLFINGLPLVFCEVKKPNNKGGIIAESNRINNVRFPNRKFRRFLNETQFMIFSNNKEYDTLGGIVPIEGAFYSTISKKKAFFNLFREENPKSLTIAPFNANYPYKEINPSIEKKILTDYNCQVIHTSPEYQTNLDINTPTNRILTSMCSKERILYILKYGICYLSSTEEEKDGTILIKDEKHIMRYSQFFASIAVKEKLSNGVSSGVIWHTQGSGKTELSYYLNDILTDYYASINKVAKFYFIVDRIDLLKQAKSEFESRGLKVNIANSRNELMNQFKSNQSLENKDGSREITVVNIQRFAEDHEKVVLPPYATNLQRIFIIDEAHRGYKPEGSFLGNLFDADRNSIKIALTGTPLLKKERASWKVFGNYIHTYYYDRSIEDGYTLKIIREPIETSYKEKLSEIYENIEKLVQKKDIKRSDIVEHDNYVNELIRYIINDFKTFRILKNDNSLGGMIICETSEQARKIFANFDNIQNELNSNSSNPTNYKVGLVLYDSDDKETQEQKIYDFKKNFKIDILIVYNMLLTGFDAPRLKKLYFGRALKDHNLLQAITRVNRPYKDNKYGYIIDFADIKKNFDETNKAYMKELSKFNDPNETGDDVPANTFESVIVDKDKIIKQLKEVQQVLFDYNTDNVEEFCSEVSTIEDKTILLELKKVLVTARDCYNLVRTFGDDELKEKVSRIDLPKLPMLISEIQHCIDTINQKENLINDNSTKILINEAMQDIKFKFVELPDEELKIIAGEEENINQLWQKTIRGFIDNIDQEDPEYLSLKQAFAERFKEFGFKIDSVETYQSEYKEIEKVLKRLKDIQEKNKTLVNKYHGDVKFARTHKRIREENNKRIKEGKNPIISKFEIDVFDTLSEIKETIDQKVYDRNDILKKDAYFEQTVMQEISKGLDKLGLENSREDRLFIQSRVASQYLEQYRNTYTN